MAREKPTCQQAQAWLKGNLGKDCFAAVTGQDWSALQAFWHLVECWGRADSAGRRHLIVAMSATVAAMQPSVRHLAKRSIPCMLDWGDEAVVWAQIEPRDRRLEAVGTSE